MTPRSVLVVGASTVIEPWAAPNRMYSRQESRTPHEKVASSTSAGAAYATVAEPSTAPPAMSAPVSTPASVRLARAVLKTDTTDPPAGQCGFSGLETAVLAEARRGAVPRAQQIARHRGGRTNGH